MKEYGWIYKDGQYNKVSIHDIDKNNDVIAYDDLGRRLIPRQGRHNIWHFALHHTETQYDCDQPTYKCNKGEWHINWQSYSPPSHLEIYKKYKKTDGTNVCHIADMIDKNGNIVEFQHSNINLDNIKSREECYDKMYWVVDATDSDYILLDNGNILIKEYKNWWSDITKPIFFDIGSGIGFLIRRLYSPKHTYYYCQFFTYESFIRSLFVLKPNVSLLDIHKNKYPSSEITFRCNMDTSYTIKALGINTSMYTEWLLKLGFIWRISNNSWTLNISEIAEKALASTHQKQINYTNNNSNNMDKFVDYNKMLSRTDFICTAAKTRFGFISISSKPIIPEFTSNNSKPSINSQNVSITDYISTLGLSIMYSNLIDFHNTMKSHKKTIT